MILTNKLSKKITNFIISNTTTTEENIELIDYGLKIIISNTFKIIILFVTAYIFNVLSYTVVALFCFGFIRMSASGTHANSTITCIIVNYIFFLGNVLFSINFQFNFYELILIFIINLIILIKYSPADTKKRPLVSKKLRLKLKIYSIISLILLFIFSLFLNNSIYKTIISISNLEAAISTTPLMYNFFKNSYRNYDNIPL